MCAFKRERGFEIPPMSEEEIREEAIRQALEIANRDGLEIGTIVGLEGDRYSYELQEIKGDTAVIGYTNTEQGTVVKEVPLSKLLDVNLARELAHKIKIGIRTIDKNQIN